MATLKKSKERYHWANRTAWFFGETYLASVEKESDGLWWIWMDDKAASYNGSKSYPNGFETLKEAKSIVEDGIRVV